MSAFDDWLEQYKLKSDWLTLTEEEDVENAFNAGLEAGKAERDRLEERLGDWQRETALAKAERDRLREALQEILDEHDSWFIHEAARKALKEQT